MPRSSKKEIVVAETDRVKIIRVINRRGQPDAIVLKNKRTGFYTAWDEDELFDLTELLDDLCDTIEDKQEG